MRKALEVATDAQPMVRVGDGQVIPAMSTLYRHHLERGYFRSAFDGMSRETDESSGVDLALVPDRVGMRQKTAERALCGCPLCRSPRAEERSLGWREYRIIPNEFPYFPPSREQSLLVPRLHRDQAFDARIVLDLVDLQRLDRLDRDPDRPPLRAYFNGRSGMSQPHLHWHLIREASPLERLLDEGRIQLDPLHAGDRIRASTFDQGPFSGILLEGEGTQVAAAAQRVIEGLEKEPLSQGAYNIAMLKPQGLEARLCIFPKRAQAHPEVELAGRMLTFGVMEMTGTLVLPEPLTQAQRESLTGALREVRVSPRNLSWLAEAVRGPSALTKIAWA